MKAAVATGFGEIDENIVVRDDWPQPTLNDLDEKERGDHIVIRVLACALAPGDVRVLSGNTDFMQLPPSGHPYVIGSDVCGVVTEIHENEDSFRIGDTVVSRFDEPKPNGGVAEYRLVKRALTEHAPTTQSPVQACTLPASAMAAKVLAKAYVRDWKKGKPRVLILGGSGGVGTFLCQYVKLYGASYIAATTTQAELCKSLGVDRVIDYRKENWWELEEFHQKDNKFDVVLDLVNGQNWQKGGCSGKAIKRDGVYAQLLTGVETDITVHGYMDIVPLMYGFVGRLLYSRLNPWVPVWHAPEALALKDGDLKELFQDVDEKRIKVILDPASPIPFTQEGVRQAMKLQKSIHAHGKVVIQIPEN